MKVPPLYQRLFIVVAIVLALAIPIAFMVWRAQHRTAADFANEAEELRAQGNAEQAKLSMDRALDMAESGAERVQILQSLVKQQQAARPESVAEALAATMSIASSQMRILHDESTNQEAANQVMAFHAAMIRAIGTSIVDQSVIEHEINLIQATNPGHEDAAEVALRRQLAIWRQQPSGTLTTSLVNERLEPIRFVAQKRLMLNLDLFFFLTQEAAANKREPEEFREMALAVLRDFAGGVAGSQQLLEVLIELHADSGIARDTLVGVALREAPNLTSAEVAAAWLVLLAADKRLVWRDGVLVHQGYLSGRDFLKALPAALANDPQLASRRLDVLWHLDDPGFSKAAEAMLARAETTLAPRPESVSIWAAASAAGRYWSESIMASGRSREVKAEELRALSKRLEGILAGEPVRVRIDTFLQILDGWSYTALPQLRRAAEQGDGYAALWATKLLDRLGAPDAAYRLRVQSMQGPAAALPPRVRLAWCTTRG